MITKITGTGSYVPPYVMDNHELARYVDTSDEWIRERTGIVCRHIATEDTVVTMAVRAAEQALQNAGLEAAEIDLIIVATSSANVVMPGAACLVQGTIGAERAACFDLNAACSGFLFAYNTAVAYLDGGIYQKALVIGSEAMSGQLNWTDRGTCILFGDGAGAVVVQARGPGAGFRPVMHTAADMKGALTLAAKCSGNVVAGPAPADFTAARYYVQMDGQAVFKFAVSRVPQVITEVLEQNRVTKEAVDFYLLHQANQRIIAAVARRLQVAAEQFPVNLADYGNTSAASIPLLLDELNKAGTLTAGSLLLLAGFGAGLSWGATLIRW